MKVLECLIPFALLQSTTALSTPQVTMLSQAVRPLQPPSLLASPSDFIIQIAFLVSLLSSTPAAVILPAFPPHTFSSVQLPIQSAGVLEEMMGKQENKV